MSSFSGVTVVLFCFVFVFLLSLKPRLFVQSLLDIHAPRQPHAVPQQLSAPFFCFFVLFCFFGNVAFSEYFCTIAVFSLYGEYVVRSFFPNGVFLPCDHGLDF